MTVSRDFADFNRGMNVPPPVINRDEFEARKANNMRRKHENERWGERYKWNFAWVALLCSDMHV